MKISALAFAAVLFAVHPAPAEAEDGEPLSDCITLAPDHQGTRNGSEQLLLKDGPAHYRLDLGGSCDALIYSARVQVETDGTANRLCPQGTTVRAKNRSCTVRTVETIEAADFARHARRRR
jgi:hypothetical protein